MAEQPWLFEEAQQRADLSQWYTSPKFAKKIIDWALSHHPYAHTILEPSAGRGALIRPILEYPDIQVCAFDVDLANAVELRKLGHRVTVKHQDFLAALPINCDLTIMNPPYENDQDVEFVLRAFEWSQVVIAVLRGIIKYGQTRWSVLWREVEIVREVSIINRPSFGGEFNPKQDFCVLELRKRSIPLKREVAVMVLQEWWHVD